VGCVFVFNGLENFDVFYKCYNNIHGMIFLILMLLGYIPYTGLAVFSSAISRVPVYTAISNDVEDVY